MLRTALRTYKTLLTFSKCYFIFSLCSIILKTIRPFIMIFFSKYVIDSIVEARPLRDIILTSAAYLFANLITAILNAKIAERISTLGNATNHYFEGILGAHMMTMDYEYLRDPRILDKREKALEGMKENSGTSIQAVNDHIISMVSASFVFSGTMYILKQQHIVLILVLIVVVVMNLRCEKAIADYEIKSWKQWIPLNRRFRIVYDLMYNFENAKDIRLYETGSFFSSKVEAYNNDSYEVLAKEASVDTKYTLVSYLFNALQQFSVYASAGVYALTSRITLGDFSMMVATVTQFTSSATDIIHSLVRIKQNFLYLDEYFSFLDLPPKKPEGKQQIGTREHVFHFVNVSFTYDTDYAIKNFNACMRTGEKIGIVGDNGAGKTTLIKLMLRLYDPTEGAILLDGVDIKDYPLSEYMALFGVVFQDFSIYPITIEENITCCTGAASEERLQEILHICSLDSEIAKHPKGVDTVMTRIFGKDGIELSIGSKQKLAIARAVYKGPPVLILDEPTAALDADAEAEVYRQFKIISKGKLSLFISHRLASCVFCDYVLVFEKGILLQAGSHAELMSQPDQKYARMFQLQADHYAK